MDTRQYITGYRVRTPSWKAASGLVLLSIIVTASVAWYVWAATPSNPIWISPGAYPGAPSYTVWRDGDNYFAKDENGYLAFSGTNASGIIQNAIDAAATQGGGDVYLLGGEKPSTAFLISYSIIVKEYVHLRGQASHGSTHCILRVYADVPGIIVNTGGVSVSNLYIDVLYDGYNHAAIFLNSSTGVNRVSISNVQIYRLRTYGYDDATAIHLNSLATNYGIQFTRFYGVYIQGGFKYGVLVNASDAAGGTHPWANGNEFVSCTIDGAQYGFVLFNSGDGVTNNNQFTDCRVQAQSDANGYTAEGIRIDGDGNTFINCKVWDMPSGNFSVHVMPEAQWTELIGSRFSTIHDEGSETVQLTAYGFNTEAYLIVKNGHPDTSDWDGNMTGALFYCTTHGCLEYWNGTHLFNLTASLIP